MLFVKNGAAEETEEGEVDDASEPEEADSDPPSPNDGLRTGYGRSLRSGNVGTSLKNRGTTGIIMENRNGAQALGPQSVDGAISDAGHHSYCTADSDILPTISQSTQTKLPSEEVKSVKSIRESKIPPGSQFPSNSVPLPVQQIPLPPPAAGPTSVGAGAVTRSAGWPPAAPVVTPTGSQQEIEHMHQMYQKACELYEKAVEKINASGLKLPTGLLPRPPAPFLHLNPNHPGNAGQIPPSVVGGAPVAGLLPPPPPPLLPPSQLSNVILGQQQNLVPPSPPTPGTLSSDPAYQTAYASAYQQTMKAIPAPQDGGPTPDTPEFAATWQRYMDHYLRYYLRTNVPSSGPLSQQQQQQQQQLPTPPPQESSSTSAKDASPPTTSELSTGVMPSNVADIALPPSPKRSCSVESSATGTGVTKTKQDPSKQPITAIPDGLANQPEQGGDQKNIQTEKTNQTDDLSTSKYVWMSNLPQGVKAVDIKDRCTPFGRVQTIKIIGSRKSKPPSIYAYLIMETPDAAGRLVDGLQGTKFGDNLIKLKRIMALPIP